MQEHNDQISLDWIIFIVLYEDKLYFSIKTLYGGH
jgi:hypothetical protein